MFFEINKNSFSEIRNQKSVCWLYRNVADDVLFQEHFTDFDYLDCFLRYERFCEPRYL